MTEVTCPRCGIRSYTPYGERWQPDKPMYPALSRADNATYVCSDCGADEALLDYTRRLDGHDPVRSKANWADPHAKPSVR